jgi:peptide/nickel transport system permease protein
VITIINPRARSLLMIAVSAAFFILLFCLNVFLPADGLTTDLLHRNAPPSAGHLLGTDTLGRDMLTRTVKGLGVSFFIGLTSAALSAVLSLILGILAATGGRAVDALVTGLVDVFMSVPHIVLLILVAFACGGGFTGIVVAVAVSHWPRLARVVRAEIMQLKESEFVKLSYKLGRGRFFVVTRHMAGHVAGQFLVGLILMFPHAILHAAGLSFLGFGLTPHEPCIGVLLSESMRFLATGSWWLAVFPGLALTLMVLVFDALGRNVRRIVEPRTREE